MQSPKSGPKKSMNPQSAAIAGSGNPLKSPFESKIRAKIFSKSAAPFTYSPRSKRSRHFLLSDHLINSHNLSLDSVWILLREIWSWSLSGLKRVKTIFRHWKCILLSVAKDGKDGHGSKLENLAMPSKITKKLLWLVFPDEICLISFLELYRSILYLVKDTK